jgi:hypothetical protein
MSAISSWKIHVQDSAGVPLRGVTVRFKHSEGVEEKFTDVDGNVFFHKLGEMTITASLPGISQSKPLTSTLGVGEKVEVDFTLDTEGLSLDQAFSDATAIDVTKPFFPLGLQPQPGSVFYFTNKEAFSKPGGEVADLYPNRSIAFGPTGYNTAARCDPLDTAGATGATFASHVELGVPAALVQRMSSLPLPSTLRGPG